MWFNMKNIVRIIMILTFISNTNYAHSQAKDEQIISMLKEFYTAHNAVWVEDIPIDILDKKLDSLQEKYCTPKLKAEAKKYFEQGFDLMTNEQGLGIEGNSLSVVKNSSKGNTYIVSYESSEADALNNKIEVHVVINVSVLKKNGNYKIDKVW